jgi:hypothetical protein
VGTVGTNYPSDFEARGGGGGVMGHTPSGGSSRTMAPLVPQMMASPHCAISVCVRCERVGCTASSFAKLFRLPRLLAGMHVQLKTAAADCKEGWLGAAS